MSTSAAQFEEEARDFEKHDVQHELDEEEQEQPEEEVVGETETQGDVPDDMTKIEGIGPKINALLQEAGISTYSQLAKADSEQLKQIIDEAGLRMVNVSTWSEQAALAADGNWDELASLQDELKAGRRLED